MPYELQEGKGYIFNNKGWESGGKLPMKRGECLVNGKPYEIAIWEPKPGKNGCFFVVGPKKDRPPKQQGTPSQGSQAGNPPLPW